MMMRMTTTMRRVTLQLVSSKSSKRLCKSNTKKQNRLLMKLPMRRSSLKKRNSIPK